MSTSDYIDLHRFCDVCTDAYPGKQLYCLVDHAGMPGLHRELVRSGLRWTSLFGGSTEESALAAAPLLFSLPAANRRFLQWLARYGTYTSSMLFLCSPEALEPLGARLADRMSTRVSEGMDVLLRYYDPRVFESLLVVLDERQLGDFLSPGDCWWYVDRSGTMQKQPAQYAPTDAGNPLELSAAQEFALLDASEIDQIAAQLESMLPDLYVGMGAVERLSFLRRHMADAIAFGIEATQDRALYCGLALLHGQDFSRVLPWRELLAKVASRSVSLSDAVAAQET